MTKAVVKICALCWLFLLYQGYFKVFQGMYLLMLCLKVHLFYCLYLHHRIPLNHVNEILWFVCTSQLISSSNIFML
jgi:hypothetical protein